MVLTFYLIIEIAVIFYYYLLNVKLTEILWYNHIEMLNNKKVMLWGNFKPLENLTGTRFTDNMTFFQFCLSVLFLLHCKRRYSTKVQLFGPDCMCVVVLVKNSILQSILVFSCQHQRGGGKVWYDCLLVGTKFLSKKQWVNVRE